ncbi:MAG: M3 family oligoendopeptidase [Candidatus Omnitrophica bacterium]|nr:M3 family oligoendopeptidase [Candidatus Omnitrophota bacterium]
MGTSSDLRHIEGLPAFQPRAYLPADIDLRDKDAVVAVYRGLLEAGVHSPSDLESWILKRSEIDAALDQAGALLYIKMTCFTDNDQYNSEYKAFEENVVPAVKPLQDRINKKYIEFKKQFPLENQRYHVYDRALERDLTLYRDENVDLQKQVSLLSQEYQAVCGAMTIVFEGQEKTLTQMMPLLEDTQREKRKAAWKSCAQRRLRDREVLDKIFNQMCALRNQMAARAGFNNFVPYQFQALHRFDYTSKECKQYQRAVKENVLPVWQKILERRKTRMGLNELRPWDLLVDPQGLAALRPFSAIDELITGVKKVFHKVDGVLEDLYNEMADLNLFDLENRKGKAPGGYQYTLAEVRKPFIFMNAVGMDNDVRTMLHESGHAFHSMLCAKENIYDYRHGPMEFCEVASMSMELLGGEHLDVFYNKEDFKRSRQMHLESIVQTLVWVANIDAFQHWIYENPGHTREERAQAWLGHHNAFGGQFINWGGLEEFQKYLWHRQLHIFEYPFYYIEYGIAQLGALQLWQHYKKNKDDTLAKYRRALSFGGSKTLPELFQEAGLVFAFSEQTIRPLIENAEKELQL